MTDTDDDTTMYTEITGCAIHVAGERGTTTGFLYANGYKIGAFVKLDERDTLMFVELHGARGNRGQHHLTGKYREIDREEFDRLQGIPAMREACGWREPSTPQVSEPDIQHVFTRKQLGDVTLCGIPGTPAPHTDKPTCTKCFDRMLTVQDAVFVALSPKRLDIAAALIAERAKIVAHLRSDMAWYDDQALSRIPGETLRKAAHDIEAGAHDRDPS